MKKTKQMVIYIYVLYCIYIYTHRLKTYIFGRALRIGMRSMAGGITRLDFMGFLADSPDFPFLVVVPNNSLGITIGQ